jgi:hypothetical protein
MARKNNDQVLKKISGKSNININLNAPMEWDQL